MQNEYTVGVQVRWRRNLLFYFLAAFLAAGFLAAGFLAAGFLAALGFLAAGFLAAFLAAGFLAFLAAGFFLGAAFFLGFSTLTSLNLPAPLPDSLAIFRDPFLMPAFRAMRRCCPALAASTL